VHDVTHVFAYAHPRLGPVSLSISFQRTVVRYVRCSVRSMLKNHFTVLAFVLCLGGIGSGQDSPHTTPSTAAPCRSTLKPVELAGKYEIKIPGCFTMGRGANEIATVMGTYFFNAPQPDSTTIRVEVLPYAGEIPINKDTGKLVAAATGDLTCEVESVPDPTALAAEGGTPPLTRYFTIADNRDVYYGCTVIDNAYECSMNSPCPLPWPPKSRYTTEYAFAVFDKETRLIIEFTGSHNGPSKRVTGFKGDGRLLRDTIVPSLTRIK